jgi:hypothetical protein
MKSTQSAGTGPLKRIELSNGLTLELYDCSRVVAGDRWHVCLAARIAIPLGDMSAQEGQKTWPGRDELAALLDDPVVFEQRLERNFIDSGEKNRLLQELCDSFIGGIAGYVSHPQFAARYVLKVYRRQLDCRRWQPEPKPPE